MPKIRPGMPKPPKGFDLIAAELDVFEAEMKEAVAAPHDGRRKVEATWEVAAVNKRRTRCVLNKFRAGGISKKVLDFCVAAGFIDGALIKLWQVPGYESVCCAECVQPRNHSFGGSCICRVPQKDRSAEVVQCSHCGCTGCCVGERKAKRDREAEGDAPEEGEGAIEVEEKAAPSS
jgi:bud site selection protein 31